MSVELKCEQVKREKEYFDDTFFLQRYSSLIGVIDTYLSFFDCFLLKHKMYLFYMNFSHFMINENTSYHEYILFFKIIQLFIEI